MLATIESSAVIRAERESLAGIGAPHVLREYALIADGERGAIVGPRGDFAWMCFPRWDSDACFASLIGGRGTYAVTPCSRFVWGGYYERGLTWRSRWITDEGVIECRDAAIWLDTYTKAVVSPRLAAPSTRKGHREAPPRD